MINPLIDSLDHLTENELEEKIIDLQRKYFLTRNPEVQLQIANILEIYKNEIRTRRMIQAQRQHQESQDNGDNSLDNLINIS